MVSVELNWFSNRVRTTPHALAVIDAQTGDAWTYEGLYERIVKTKRLLQILHVTKGQCVMLISENHVCYIELLIACSQLGAILVPINWRLSTKEIEEIIEDCNPVCLFVSEEQIEKTKGLSISQICIGSKTYREFIQQAENEQEKFSEIEKEDPLLLLYTGGTTGRAKGVILTHENIITNAVNTIITWNLCKNDVTLNMMPMFHTGGLNALCVPLLYIGGTVVLVNKFRADKVTSLLNQYGCTIVLMVPTMYKEWIDSPSFVQSTTTVHTFLSGGAPCPFEIYDTFCKKGWTFKQGYGLTEAGPNNFYMDPSTSYRKKGAVGKPMMYVEAKIVNKEGMEVETNRVGELLLKGNHVCKGYWQRDEETAKAIVNKWLYTGDLAMKDEDGDYYIVDRKKDMIITGGENVYPMEVERCLACHPAIDQVVVLGIKDDKWGESVIAIIKPFADKVVTLSEVKDFCYGKLASYKIPKKIKIVPSFPTTSVGKIDKKALKELIVVE